MLQLFYSVVCIEFDWIWVIQIEFEITVTMVIGAGDLKMNVFQIDRKSFTLFIYYDPSKTLLLLDNKLFLLLLSLVYHRFIK